MIGSFFNRRRINRFADLIDETSTRPRHTRSTIDDTLTDMVAVSRRLSTLPIRVEADDQFRDSLEAVLMATIDREGLGATAQQPEPKRARAPLASRTRRTRGAIGAGVLAGVLAVSGMSIASGDSVPGDSLYSVKRSAEKAQLALAGSDFSRGLLHLEFARSRAAEALTIVADGRAGRMLAKLDPVLSDVDAETTEGVRVLNSVAVTRSNVDALDAIDAFVTGQRGTIGQLTISADDDAHARMTQSMQLLSAVDLRSKALRQMIGCSPAVYTEPDSLGPVPASSNCLPSGHNTGQQSSTPTVPGPTGQPTATRSTGAAADPGASNAASLAPPATPAASASTCSGLLCWLLRPGH